MRRSSSLYARSGFIAGWPNMPEGAIMTTVMPSAGRLTASVVPTVCWPPEMFSTTTFAPSILKQSTKARAETSVAEPAEEEQMKVTVLPEG